MIDWDKMGGLVPAVVQHATTGEILMLGYMNPEALEATKASGFATFFSRSKQRLWRKGETSGNGLRVSRILTDCDGDALLLLAAPEGPTCHTGMRSCFGEESAGGIAWLGRLAEIVRQRAEAGHENSYTARLVAEGPVRIAQKIGEEGVEVALAAATGDRAGLKGEIADLVYHLTVLMETQGLSWDDVAATLKARHQPVTPG